MVPPLALTGQRFGRLLVTRRTENIGKSSGWECICDCGKTTKVRGDVLKRGDTLSCGCFAREVQIAAMRKANIKHGMSTTREYYTWNTMMRRCRNPKDKKFYAYGAKGINVCQRWETFSNFRSDMGERPEGKTLDRINGHLGYFPENCRWADALTQRHNRIS